MISNIFPTSFQHLKKCFLRYWKELLTQVWFGFSFGPRLGDSRLTETMRRHFRELVITERCTFLRLESKYIFQKTVPENI